MTRSLKIDVNVKRKICLLNELLDGTKLYPSSFRNVSVIRPLLNLLAPDCVTEIIHHLNHFGIEKKLQKQKVKKNVQRGRRCER